ncbi:MAG: ATP synthase delta/epsilon chain alpha-helix domain-containing protein, partial [Thermoleophilia bacterium]
PRHAPIVSKTAIGEVRVKLSDSDRWDSIAVGNGYVKMQFDRLLLLVDTAERESEIDVERAQQALNRAEKYLARAGEPDVDAHRAEQSRRRALNRLRTAGIE